jgi:HAD superfamily hydrolase (TIGR01484 family)
MRFHALATDYDGTLAHHGRVSAGMVESLRTFLASGRRLLLVTGRELPELLQIFPAVHLFEWVVAENGALLYQPDTQEEQRLAEPPPREFVEALTSRGVAPISVGRVIVATWEPHEQTVLETIRDLGLELQVIFNKGAVMVLPTGVNKASGLAAALQRMNLSPHNVVGVGDAENDHAFLKACELSAAVANALPAVKDTADVVLAGDHGEGVRQLMERIVADDLDSVEKQVLHQRVPLDDPSV